MISEFLSEDTTWNWCVHEVEGLFRQCQAIVLRRNTLAERRGSIRCRLVHGISAGKVISIGHRIICRSGKYNAQDFDIGDKLVLHFIVEAQQRLQIDEWQPGTVLLSSATEDEN